MNLNALLFSIRAAKTREQAKDITKTYLSQQGWFLTERHGFDVYGVKSDRSRVIIKFWFTPSKRPVPKSFIKKFDIAVQEFTAENDYKEKVLVFFISNSVLDHEAWDYYKVLGRYTMKVVVAANDIEAQLSRLDKAEQDTQGVQKQLLQYAKIA